MVVKGLQMNSIHRSRIVPVVSAMIAAAMLGGCTKKIPLVQYPVFWDKAPKTIAVTPFRNQTITPHVGRQISNDLATALAVNGCYKVYDRSLLKAYLNEHDLQRAFSSDRDIAASQMVKVGRVQAILTGSVTTAHCPPTRVEIRMRRRRFTDRWGRTYTRPVRHYYYRNEATITANAVLLRITARGPEVIHSYQARGQARSEGESPRRSRLDCLADARYQVVRQLVEQFAVVRRTIEVKPSEAFFTASGPPYDGKWPEEDEFSAASDQKIILVLKLPPQCDRNRFRITVARKDTRRDIEVFEVVWTRAMSAAGRRFILSPADLAAKGGGPGKYHIKFYSGPAEPVMVHKIKIEP